MTITITDEITNDDDIIDSREIIERIKKLAELADEYKEKHKLPTLDWEDKWEGSEYDEWDKKHPKNKVAVLAEKWEEWGFYDEYVALKAIEQECEGYGDWKWGTSLIRDSYFRDYIQELVEECYEMPEEFNSGKWPWRHMTMDWEAAADEAKYDYMCVDFDGVDYYMQA